MRRGIKWERLLCAIVGHHVGVCVGGWDLLCIIVVNHVITSAPAAYIQREKDCGLPRRSSSTLSEATEVDNGSSSSVSSFSV